MLENPPNSPDRTMYDLKKILLKKKKRKKRNVGIVSIPKIRLMCLYQYTLINKKLEIFTL